MRVNIKLFAAYREKVGKSQFELDLPDGSDMEQLARAIVALHPTITQNPLRLAIAVNQEFVDSDTILKDGDEIALIPPVSGGCIHSQKLIRKIATTQVTLTSQ